MNFIKEQLAIWKLKRSLRSYVQPDKTFLNSTKEKFVLMSQQRNSASVIKHYHLMKYATVFAVVALSMVTGLSVFADVSDVSVAHPLYDFKRVSEQVRLKASSPVKQVELHRVFATRRLQEVVELENENLQHKNTPQESIQPTPSSVVKNKPEETPIKNEIKDADHVKIDTSISNQKRIDRLNKDFQNEVEGVLGRVQRLEDSKDVRGKFCKDILNTVKQKDAEFRLSEHLLEDIKSRCDSTESTKGSKD
ncbi:MAG: hypothetical protein KBC81_01340 [Candidatus Pacebacteria bacterium]|nr:hypothetical protein [Candidatus Paceibacterota bacterium]